MAKFDIEKHLGQEACQRTCSIFFFVEKFLKRALTHGVFAWYSLPYIPATKDTYT